MSTRPSHRGSLARERHPRSVGSPPVPSPLAGGGTMAWQTVRMGEGPFVAMYPSPIIASGNTEVPSPARGEGTVTATAAVDLTLGGMVQRDCVLPAGPPTSFFAPPPAPPAPRPPSLPPPPPPRA